MGARKQVSDNAKTLAQVPEGKTPQRQAQNHDGAIAAKYSEQSLAE